MVFLTTFLWGAVAGGSGKWIYDKWQEMDERPTIASVRDKSAETVRNVGNATSNLVRGKKPESAEPAAA